MTKEKPRAENYKKEPDRTVGAKIKVILDQRPSYDCRKNKDPWNHKKSLQSNTGVAPVKLVQ